MDFGIDGGDGLGDGVVAGGMDGECGLTVGCRKSGGTKVHMRIF